MKARLFVTALALASAVACSDQQTPTGPTDQGKAATPQFKPAVLSTLSTTFTTTVTNSLNQVGTFNGTATITSFTTNAAGDLIAHGTLVGNITGGFTQSVNTTFQQVVTNQLTQRCTILHLVLGPIFLDLLGLQVTTNQIVLDITAVSGPGNLLGNLLCALVHILDQNPLATLVGQLLAQINAILSALL
jgi:hypothetical protein